MANSTKEFYENWAKHELLNPHRTAILQWKAANFANMIFRTLKNDHISSICEIGGSEGIILDSIGHMVHANELVNFELSDFFCGIGHQTFPNIRFVNKEFNQNCAIFDLIILSDILEHVDNDDLFLDLVRKHCKYAVFKIPIEKCIETNLIYWFRKQSISENLKYGPEHYNGHLRGYTFHQAKSKISKYFDVIDSIESDVLFFYGTVKRNQYKRLLGSKISSLTFGGAFFALGVSKE